MPAENAVEIVYPDILALTGEQSGVIAAAKRFEVRSEADLDRGSGLIRIIKELRAKISKTFDEPIKKAHEAHRSFHAAKKAHDAPLAEEEAGVKSKIAKFVDEARRKAEAEQRTRDEEARKKREEEQRIKDEQALREAAAAEEEGDVEKAEEILEEADNTPPPPEPVPVPIRATPKVDGIRTSKTWAAKVTDIKALAKAVADGTVPAHFIEPNMTELNRVARAMKSVNIMVPGAAGFSSTKVSSR